MATDNLEATGKGVVSAAEAGARYAAHCYPDYQFVDPLSGLVLTLKVMRQKEKASHPGASSSSLSASSEFGFFRAKAKELMEMPLTTLAYGGTGGMVLAAAYQGQKLIGVRYVIRRMDFWDMVSSEDPAARILSTLLDALTMGQTLPESASMQDALAEMNDHFEGKARLLFHGRKGDTVVDGIDCPPLVALGRTLPPHDPAACSPHVGTLRSTDGDGYAVYRLRDVPHPVIHSLPNSMSVSPLRGINGWWPCYESGIPVPYVEDSQRMLVRVPDCSRQANRFYSELKGQKIVLVPWSKGAPDTSLKILDSETPEVRAWKEQNLMESSRGEREFRLRWHRYLLFVQVANFAECHWRFDYVLIQQESSPSASLSLSPNDACESSSSSSSSSIWSRLLTTAPRDLLSRITPFLTVSDLLRSFEGINRSTRSIVLSNKPCVFDVRSHAVDLMPQGDRSQDPYGSNQDAHDARFHAGRFWYKAGLFTPDSNFRAFEQVRHRMRYAIGDSGSKVSFFEHHKIASSPTSWSKRIPTLTAKYVSDPYAQGLCDYDEISHLFPNLKSLKLELPGSDSSAPDVDVWQLLEKWNRGQRLAALEALAFVGLRWSKLPDSMFQKAAPCLTALKQLKLESCHQLMNPADLLHPDVPLAFRERIHTLIIDNAEVTLKVTPNMLMRSRAAPTELDPPFHPLAGLSLLPSLTHLVLYVSFAVSETAPRPTVGSANPRGFGSFASDSAARPTPEPATFQPATFRLNVISQLEHLESLKIAVGYYHTDDTQQDAKLAADLYSFLSTSAPLRSLEIGHSVRERDLKHIVENGADSLLSLSLYTTERCPTTERPDAMPSTGCYQLNPLEWDAITKLRVLQRLQLETAYLQDIIDIWPHLAQMPALASLTVATMGVSDAVREAQDLPTRQWINGSADCFPPLSSSERARLIRQYHLVEHESDKFGAGFRGKLEFEECDGPGTACLQRAHSTRIKRESGESGAKEDAAEASSAASSSSSSGSSSSASATSVTFFPRLRELVLSCGQGLSLALLFQLFRAYPTPRLQSLDLTGCASFGVSHWDLEPLTPSTFKARAGSTRGVLYRGGNSGSGAAGASSSDANTRLTLLGNFDLHISMTNLLDDERSLRLLAAMIEEDGERVTGEPEPEGDLDSDSHSSPLLLTTRVPVPVDRDRTPDDDRDFRVVRLRSAIPSANAETEMQRTTMLAAVRRELEEASEAGARPSRLYSLLGFSRHACLYGQLLRGLRTHFRSAPSVPATYEYLFDLFPELQAHCVIDLEEAEQNEQIKEG